MQNQPSPTPTMHRLAATPETIHWGFFSSRLRPVLHIRSGDYVHIETITHHAGDAPDVLIDAGIAPIFEQVTDRGPGPHILTGPIHVEGARPGDTLAVRILDATPRLPYGANLAAHWGALYKEFGKERVTIYALDTVRNRATAAFAFDWTETPLANAPGRLLDPATQRREPALVDVNVPLRPHFGVMGVAPAGDERVDSVPPGEFGGNVDNWRIGPGSTVYYPVYQEGALLSLGDPHAAEGDGELSGTAVEASLNGVIEVTVLRDMPLRAPVAETPELWITHGFGADLDTAMHGAAMEMLRLLTERHGFSRDDAYSLMSAGVDFGVTQVVNRTKGVHALLSKSLLPSPPPAAAT
jgi:acetamidase/formamidase